MRVAVSAESSLSLKRFRFARHRHAFKKLITQLRLPAGGRRVARDSSSRAADWSNGLSGAPPGPLSYNIDCKRDKIPAIQGVHQPT